MTSRKRPYRFTSGQMAKVGVEITDPNSVRLRCTACGQSWSPNLRPGGLMPPRYWHCPQGCNVD